MTAERGHFEAVGLSRLADAVAAVLDLCDEADASLRGAVPMSAAESIIDRGDHTVKVGKVRRAISKALADVDGRMPCPHGGPLSDCVNPDGAS